MQTRNTSDALLLGLCLLIGLALLGYLLGDAAIRYKEYERTVIVKGLSEREFPADIVIWPIQFTSADNDLESLYQTIEINTGKISDFLLEQGIAAGEISATPPTIVDKAAQRFGDGPRSRVSLLRGPGGDGVFEPGRAGARGDEQAGDARAPGHCVHRW